MISHAHVLCIIYLFWWFPSTCYLRFEKDERYRSRAYQRVAVIREFLYPQTLNIYTHTCNKIFQAVIKTPSIGSGRFIIVAPFSPGQVFNRSRSSHFHLVHINSPNIRYKSAQNNHSQSVKLPLYCFTPTVSLSNRRRIHRFYHFSIFSPLRYPSILFFSLSTLAAF